MQREVRPLIKITTAGTRLLWILCGCWVLSSGFIHANSIRGSKHDLSSPDNDNSSQVCHFCHTPHRANNTLGPMQAPLWNRYVDTSLVFTVFTSPTMNTTPGSPSMTYSALCLGCHDGSVGAGSNASYATVYGVTGHDKHNLIQGNTGSVGSTQCLKCHNTGRHGGTSGALLLGKDLSTMHPIAMTYPTGSQDPMFNPPPDLQQGWPDLKLFFGKVECSTCHKVHDPAITPFLRKSNNGSALCLTCHMK
jgi:predicted CXXCH cytochrome family protein